MLQRFIRSTSFATVVLVALLSVSSSFTITGGDVFEVYINKKLAVQQYVHLKEPAKTLQLEQGSAPDEIDVYYSHCGKAGTSRTVSIRDAHNKVLKEWRFQDTPAAKAPMSCSLKDVSNLQKPGNGNLLGLYYTSAELPAGQLLAHISTASAASAKR